MPSTSERGVFGPALRVVLHGDARPMVHGVGEPVVAGLSSDDDAAFARSLGDWRDSCQTAQGGVVTSLQRIEGFCKQRGEDDPSHSRQGCEDLHVMLLPLPSERLLLIVHTRNFGPSDVHSVGGPFSGFRVAPTGPTSEETMLGAGYWLAKSPMKPGRGNSGSVGGGMAVHEKRAPTRLSGPRWGHSFVAAARQRLCRGACAGMEFFCGFPEDSIEMPLQGSQCCEACGDGVGGVAQIPVCPLRKAPRSAMFTKKEPRRDCRGPVRDQGEVANETTKCFVSRARHLFYRFTVC